MWYKKKQRHRTGAYDNIYVDFSQIGKFLCEFADLQIHELFFYTCCLYLFSCAISLPHIKVIFMLDSINRPNR